MRVQNRTRRAHRRAAALAAATAVVAGTMLAGAPAQATTSSAAATVVDDVLVVTGTSAGDRITIDFTALDSVLVDLGGSNGTRRFASGGFHSASVDLSAGDDELRTVSGGSPADVPMTVAAGNGDDVVTTGAGSDVLDGGNGEDLLLGGAGTDLVLGGTGADFVNGGIGTDVEVLGNGDDTAAWNPGEGNDGIDGGLGLDTLAFNGANGDEQMSLSANGRSALFLRAQGSIRMDLDDVERLDLATLGGVDTVTVNDLSGTDLTTADIDLAAADGSGDLKDDIVQVNGTAGSDRVDVTASGSTVEVAGLAARTSITGGETRDHLQVNGGEGDDQVTVADAARALLDIQTDLGAGQS
jgi:hypothetical protein